MSCKSLTTDWGQATLLGTHFGWSRNIALLLNPHHGLLQLNGNSQLKSLH
jgi:hypothetical protein